MKELKLINWTKWMKKIGLINWHEWIRMNWNEWFVDLILKKWSESVSFLQSFCDGQPLYPKNTGFAPESVFSREFTCSRSLTHDDVADMMVRQLAVTIVRNIVDLNFKKRNKPVSLLRCLCEIVLSLQSHAHFVDFIFKKCKNAVRLLRFLCEIELWLQSRAHFVDLIFNKCTILMWNQALPTVSCTFFRPHLEKVVRNRKFLMISMWNRALATVSCTFCRPLPDRGAHPRKQTPSSGDRGQPLCPKKHMVLRPRVFSAVNSHVPDRSHMMMWLTWWCDS